MRRLIPILFATLLTAHPMGNFSVSHFAKFDVTKKSVNVTYVLDLAEIPTYQLLRDWNLDPTAETPQIILDEKARAQAQSWLKNLDFGGATPILDRASVKLTPGAGGMRVARIESALHLENATGNLSYEDKNYPDRAGWKEIVISSSDRTPILEASHSGDDRSSALTAYPADPTQAPPQDLRAHFEWQTTPVTVTKIVPIPQPAAPVTQASTPTPASKPAAGELTRGDYLSRMLSQRDIPFDVMLIGLAVAFAFGALHAKSPGHGKTMVAAYLVGSRGTMKHAAFLGAMVTLTHTISVFLLGLVTLVFAKYLAPEKLVTWLGIASGVSIVAIGASLFYKRLRALKPHTHTHAHHHHHHDHDHDHHHHHDHEHGPHTHTHEPAEITLRGLIALGASGGLVPCPSALVLLLVAISLGHIGLGLLLLVAFSLGLAGVLMAIGMLVIYAKQWLPDPAQTAKHPLFRLVPIFSAFVIVCVGLIMTAVSAGWIKPTALLS
jgi:ABC-type nickel/cobalt efflux system permease component RcnA